MFGNSLLALLCHIGSFGCSCSCTCSVVLLNLDSTLVCDVCCVGFVIEDRDDVFVVVFVCC